MQNQYIILSSIEWNTIWQTQQKLADSLSKNNKVLFVENTGIRSPNIKDAKRIKDRIINWYNSTSGFKEINKNLLLFFPLIVPLPYSFLARKLNSFLIYRSIDKWLKIHNSGNIIVITFLPSPLSISLIDKINPNILIYYCANRMIGHNNQHKKLISWEQHLIKKSDAIYVISEELKKYTSTYNTNIKKFPAGVEYAKFASATKANYIPNAIKKIKNPIVGYVGAITKVFDIDLVAYVASANPKISFVFIGPKFIDCKKITKLTNVYLINQVSHNELPHYMKRFDIGIIPYIINDFTNSVYNSKLNEYLSVGLPVISTNMNEIKYFNNDNENIINIAKNNSDFSNLINKTLSSRDKNIILKRINIAKMNSWEKRSKDIEEHIDNLLKNKVYLNDNWKIKISKISNLRKNIYIKLTSTFLILFFIIFYSPLFWFLGNNLIIRDIPKKSEAIVIFSGNGEPAYQNPSYQKRTLDGLKYYKEGLANKIYLTSGRKQLFDEVQLIESLLISNGIPKSAITVIDKYPKNTYENVILTEKYLRNDKVKKIIFITSPFHSLRSNLIWKSNFDYITINNPSVLDTPSNQIQWTSNLKTIRVVIYEYLAIIFNFYKGYLKLW